MSDRPAVPRMRGDWKPRHRIMAYAARMRVFTVTEVMRDLNVAAAHGIDEALRNGDILRHSVDVYSVHGVYPNDPRVLSAIAREQNIPVSDGEILRQGAKSEQREAERLEARLPGDTPEDRIERFLRKTPVFFRTTAVAAGLGRTDDVLKALLVSERIRKVDQLHLRQDIEIDDPRVDAFLQAHSQEGATIISEIEAARKVHPGNARIQYELEKRGWTDADGVLHPRQSRLHMRVPGCPPVYGTARGANRTAGIDWHGAGLSRITAEAIARKVLSPMPATMAELLGDIRRGTAPLTVKRRNTGLPVAQSRDEQGPWGVPQARRVPIAVRTTLTIDTSEDDEVLAALTGIPNLHVDRARLKTGDYRLHTGTAALTIERKTVTDLAASFDDGRLATQIPRLAALGHPAFVLVEGDMHATQVLSPAKLARLQAKLAALNIGFLTTRDQAGTAYMITTLVRDLLENQTNALRNAA